MILNISLNDHYDFFFLSNKNVSNIKITTPITCEELILYFQATLFQNKFVIFSNEEIFNPNLEVLRAKHSSIESGKFIYLNYSLKKKISKAKNSTKLLNNYQDVESFLQETLSTIF